MLGARVVEGADGACGAFIRAGLVRVAESETVAAVSGDVRGVNRSNPSGLGKQTDVFADSGGVFRGEGDNDGGGCFEGALFGVRLEEPSRGDMNVCCKVDV
jgi:hypothetical protein